MKRFQRFWRKLIVLFFALGGAYWLVDGIPPSDLDSWCAENTTCEEGACCLEAYNQEKSQ